MSVPLKTPKGRRRDGSEGGRVPRGRRSAARGARLVIDGLDLNLDLALQAGGARRGERLVAERLACGVCRGRVADVSRASLAARTVFSPEEGESTARAGGAADAHQREGDEAVVLEEEDLPGHGAAVKGVGGGETTGPSL